MQRMICGSVPAVAPQYGHVELVRVPRPRGQFRKSIFSSQGQEVGVCVQFRNSIFSSQGQALDVHGRWSRQPASLPSQSSRLIERISAAVSLSPVRDSFLLALR
eukprot:10893369-Heterocapsa_arctica.AAC.1